MKLRFGHLAMMLLMAAAAPVAHPQRGSVIDTEENPVHLPNGKRQQDEILKVEHEQNLKDAARLAELAQQLQLELEKNDRFVLSLDVLKKTDEIEKLARKIRSRLRHN
jgi:hypothetical protein